MKSAIFSSKTLSYLGIFLLIFSLVSLDDAYAQRRSKSYLKKKNRKIGKYKGGSIHFDKNKRYISLGGSIDAMNYFGDLAPKSQIASTKISLTRPAFTIYGSYRYTPNLTLRGSLSWGRLMGDDFEADPYGDDSKFRYVRNLSFRNDIKEIAFVAVWDFFGNHGTFLNRVPFTPYVFAGIAGFHHNPKGKVPVEDKFGNPLDNAGEWVALKPLGTEGQLSAHYDVKEYSLFQGSIPFGFGIRAKLQKRLDFEFEVGYRFLFTDYIDDVSGMYVDLGALANELARTMSDRSNYRNEPVSAPSGSERDVNAISAVTGINEDGFPLEHTYTSRFDGEDYTVYGGWGSDQHPDNNRGFANDKDIYIVTSFKISYIISGSFKRAKFR